MTSVDHYKVLNTARIDTVGKTVVLTFSEEQEDRSYKGLEFTLDKIEMASAKRVVFSGMGSVNGKTPEKMYIQYLFSPNDKKNENHFYRVGYYAGGSIRRLHVLELDNTNSPEDIRNAKLCNKLLKFITDYLYTIDDGITEIKAK